MTAIASSSVRKERDIAIDLAKGICIILMVAGHAMYSGGWFGYFLILFRMPCFFIASGFLFKEKNFADPKGYIRRKFKGLYWPFVFWSLLFLAFHNVFARMHLYSNYLTINEMLMGGVRYVLTAGTEQLLGGFWFLSSLLFATVAGYAYYKWIGFSTKALVIGIIISLALAELMCALGINMKTIHLNSRDFTALAYIFTGTLFSRINQQHLRKYCYALVVAAIILLSLQATFMPVGINHLRAGTVIPFYITSTTAALALIRLCYLAPHISITKTIAKIGTRTIDVLIFHMLMFKVVTIIVIAIEHLPIELLSAFPVPNLNGLWYGRWIWVVYTVVAVTLSYWIGQGIIVLKKRFHLLEKIIP